MMLEISWLAKRLFASQQRPYDVGYEALGQQNNAETYTVILFQGLSLRYKFLMTNGPPGDYWHEHFSADEFCEWVVYTIQGIVDCVLVFCRKKYIS
jgi:hypothetical protein